MKNELLKLIKIISSTNRLDPNTIKKLEWLAEEIKEESVSYKTTPHRTSPSKADVESLLQDIVSFIDSACNLCGSDYESSQSRNAAISLVRKALEEKNADLISWKAECHELRTKLKMAETALDVRNQEAWEERRRAESAEEENAELVKMLKQIRDGRGITANDISQILSRVGAS